MVAMALWIYLPMVCVIGLEDCKGELGLRRVSTSSEPDIWDGL